MPDRQTDRQTDRETEGRGDGGGDCPEMDGRCRRRAVHILDLPSDNQLDPRNGRKDGGRADGRTSIERRTVGGVAKKQAWLAACPTGR